MTFLSDEIYRDTVSRDSFNTRPITDPHRLPYPCPPSPPYIRGHQNTKFKTATQAMKAAGR